MVPGPMTMMLRGVFAQNRTRTVLSVLAIALGVALGYAVQLINSAAVNELAQGVKTLSGDADLKFVGRAAASRKRSIRWSRAYRRLRWRAPSSRSMRRSPGAMLRFGLSASMCFAQAICSRA
jgi:uncharacterized membrane protein YbhN (UPF0104 family)